VNNPGGELQIFDCHRLLPSGNPLSSEHREERDLRALHGLCSFGLVGADVHTEFGSFHQMA
jgi:hypothetical protein